MAAGAARQISDIFNREAIVVPNPLHPAVVHFPIVLAVLLPVAAIAALIAIRMGSPLRRTWSVPVAVALALTLSVWASVETGEDQEDRVEAVVPEEAIHTHEERAERFFVLSGTVLAVLATGLLPGSVGAAARLVGTAGALALLVPMAQVGASGGELVYEHGAASAYIRDATRSSGSKDGHGSVSPELATPDADDPAGDDPDWEFRR